MPRHAVPEPGRPRRDPQGPERAGARAAGPERRLPRLQHAPRSRSTTCACARPSTWRSTRRPSSTACTCGTGVAAKNPIPPTHVVVQRRDQGRPVRSRQPPRSCWPRPATRTASTTDLWAMPVQRPYNPNAKRIAELMQADLAKVGVKAEIKSFEWGEYRKRMQAGEHQMGMLGWTGDNGDPDNFLHTLLGCDVGQDQRLQRRQVLLPAVRGPGPEGQDGHQAGRARRAVQAGAGDLQGAGAVVHHRPRGAAEAGAQGSDRLQAVARSAATTSTASTSRK